MTGPVDKLVRMINQIAAEFEHQQGPNAANATWDHIWHFWDPRMCAAIISHQQAGGTGLSPTAKAAVRRLATERTPEPQTRATEFGVDAEGNTEGDAG